MDHDWNHLAPLAVTFDASTSSDVEAGALEYRWDFENNGNWESWSPSPNTSHSYPTQGQVVARLEVRDADGMTGSTPELVWVSGS